MLISLRRLVVLLISVLLLAGPFGASAQTSPFIIRLHDVRGPTNVQDQTGLPGLALEIDFSILDTAGLPASDAEPATAYFDLTSGLGFPTVVKKAADPWSVVIVLDASKTVAASKAIEPYKKAREAFASLVGTFPQGSNLAVLTFQSQPTTVQGFIQDSAKIAEKVRGNLVVQGESCLNAGLFEAANLLAGASGRRAIFLLTASGDACGNRVPQDVVTLAQRNHIQIYAVGLKGYSITDAELNAFTESTGGVYRTREQDEALFAFQEVLRVINGQFEAQVTVYPPAGLQTGLLNLTLKDGTQVASPVINFESDREYTQPVQLALKGVVRSTLAGVEFNLDYVSPQLIRTLTLQAIDLKTGLAVIEKTIAGGQLAETNTLGDVNSFEPGGKYRLNVIALDAQGFPIAQVQSEFDYQPPEAQFAIASVERPTPENLLFTVELASKNLPNLVKYKLWLVTRENTTEPVEDSVQTIAAGEPLTLSAEALETGTYQIVVQALDAENKVLAQAISEEQPYERQSALQAFINWVSANPLAIVGLTLACVVAVLVLGGVMWMLLPKRSAQPKVVDLALPERQRRAVSPESTPPAMPRPVPPPPRPAPPPAKPVEPARPAAMPSMTQATIRASDLPPVLKGCFATQEPAYLNLKAEVTKSPFTLGRKAGNELALPLGNTSGVSSHHATVTIVDGKFWLTDDNSSYGTFLNGQRLAANQPTPLTDGAVIGLGPQVRIVFHLNC